MEVWPMSLEDPLENGMAPHSSILAWRILWTGEHSRLQSMGSQRIRHDWAQKHTEIFKSFLAWGWLRQFWSMSLECEACLSFVSLVSQFSRSVVSDSLRPHESQHARPPCPPPSPRVHPNSCPSSQWCHPAISSSVVPFSSCPQSLPASGSFPMSQLFT